MNMIARHEALIGKTFRWLVAVALTGSAVAGCGQEGDMDADLVEAPIIGGNAVTVATRRSLGLIDVNGGCSGSLLTTDWVLTATHCIDFATPSNNSFGAPRPDGTIASRAGNTAVQLGTSDLTIVKLAPSTPDQNWPNVTRNLRAQDPNNMVGRQITCYGRGNTGYASPSGLTGFGQWRTLTGLPLSLSNDVLNVNATAAGTEITAPGDSGGLCTVFGESPSEAAAVVSGGSFECADDTSAASCSSTITKIDTSGWRVTADFADFVFRALTRPNASFQTLPLVNGWVNAPFGTNNAGVTLVSGIVHFRGAVSGGTASRITTLPSAFRPAQDVYVPVTLCDATKGRLFIDSSGNVSVQEEGGGFSNAPCFTSLEGASFAQSTSSFTSLTLQNGWTNAPFGTRNARVRNVSGIVRFQGAIANGTSSAAFVLPSAFRPPTDVYIPIDLCSATKGRLLVQPSGQVSVFAETAFSNAQCFSSLEGASFALSTSGFSGETLLNGWTNAPFSTRNAAATNIAGIVRLGGAIATSGNNATAFTLQAGFRPATNVYVPVDLCGAAKGRLLINPLGTVTVEYLDFAAAACFTSLEGVSFGL
jgi:hypothetical protein